MVKLAIVGSRNCKNIDCGMICEHIPAGTSLILSGGAAGVDTMAEHVAAELCIAFETVLPDYEKYGKSAPVVRNRVLVEKADRVLAFWDYQSRGTANTIAVCIDKQVPVEVIGINSRK